MSKKFNNEAPRDVEEAIPASASRGVSFHESEAHPEASAERSDYGKKRLSAVSQKYDLDGDGQLDDAEQAMRNMDKSGRGFLKNEEVYKMMVDQLQMQKDLFKMKKVVIGLMVFVVILALSNLGTSFASAILAKDSTTNDQNELVSKETGEALATQTTSKVIVIDKDLDQEFARQRKLECTEGGDRVQGSFTELDCTNINFVNIAVDDGASMAEMCYRGNTVTITNSVDGSTVVTQVCSDPEGGTLTFPDDSFTGNGNNRKPTEMSIIRPNGAINLIDRETHYSLDTITCDTNLGYSGVELVDGFGACTCPSGTEDQGEGIGCVPVGGQAAITCEDGDEPVCGADGTPYDCEAMADGAALASPPTACQCGGVSGRDPNNSCLETECQDPVCAPCSTGHFPTDSCCTQCTDLNGGYVDFPGVTPTSDADCDTGYLFDSSTDTCIQCDAGSGYAVVSGSCACPEGTTEENGACVANSSGGGCQFEDSTAVCVGTTYYVSAADVPVGETCSEAPVCAAFVCEGGGSPQPCNNCQCPTPK